MLDRDALRGRQATVRVLAVGAYLRDWITFHRFVGYDIRYWLVSIGRLMLIWYRKKEN